MPRPFVFLQRPGRPYRDVSCVATSCLSPFNVRAVEPSEDGEGCHLWPRSSDARPSRHLWRVVDVHRHVAFEPEVADLGLKDQHTSGVLRQECQLVSMKPGSRNLKYYCIVYYFNDSILLLFLIRLSLSHRIELLHNLPPCELSDPATLPTPVARRCLYEGPWIRSNSVPGASDSRPRARDLRHLSGRQRIVVVRLIKGVRALGVDLGHMHSKPERRPARSLLSCLWSHGNCTSFAVANWSYNYTLAVSPRQWMSKCRRDIRLFCRPTVAIDY